MCIFSTKFYKNNPRDKHLTKTKMKKKKKTIRKEREISMLSNITNALNDDSNNKLIKYI